MSAELVDPFATPEPERLKPADMCEDINARLVNAQWDDRTLYPQLLAKTLHELQRCPEPWAYALLEQLHHRAVSGVEFGEPQEPTWSLDSERRLPR